eukprot:TRINITY_DN44181_c0_g1_i1.p1 TRINITY_DN44181_c0_g1~~TRINITY_DN44181_c0_g1_i1.p1  ORF type:complete len:228 (+),score=36.12 TRINITY_DN44181_c0_g1_i1:94-777(+)
MAGGKYNGPPLKLYYFNVCGKGESIRWALAYGGVPFEDVRPTFEEFDKLKKEGTVTFGQLPCLVVGDSPVVQSAAILRYVAKIAAKSSPTEMYPEDPLLAAKVDAILDLDTDMMTGHVSSQYARRFGFGGIMDRSGPPEKRARYGEVRTALHDEVLPRHLEALSGLVSKSASGWIAGTAGPSIADFMIVSTLQRLLGRSDGPPMGLGDGFSAGLVARHPSLMGLVEK